FILAVILTYIAIYTTYIGQLLNVTTIWAIVWIMVGISAIVFPYYRKDLAQNMAGARLLPIFGVLTIIAMGMTFYWSITNPAIGPSTFGSTLLLVAIFGSGLLIFAARYLYFKPKGIDLIHVQREIPPE